MATFQFRLQRILEWREAQFRLEHSRLATRMADLHRVEQDITRLNSERLAVEREVITEGSISPADLAALGSYRLYAIRQELQLLEQRTCRERAVREQSAVAQAAQKKLRLVEKLHERRLAEYLSSEDRTLEALAAESYLCVWAQHHRRVTKASVNESNRGS